MGRYALLILPSTNRVYAAAAVAMTQAELKVLNRSVLDNRLAEVPVSAVGGLSLAFSHRVGRAIMPDVIVARKP